MDHLTAPQRPLLTGPVRDDAVGRNALSVLFKWKWLIVGAFAAVFLPVTIMSYLQPTSYRAKVTTMVKKDRSYLSITPSGDDQLVNLPISRSTINSEIKIITSREVIERVVEELAVEDSGEVPHPDQPPVDRSAGIAAIQRALEVTPINESNLIEIAFRSSNPERAVKVVNKIADVYVERHAQINSPQGAHRFFETQASQYFERLQEASEALRQFGVREGTVNLEKEIAETQLRIAQMERDKQAAETEMNEMRMRMAFLKGEIARHPEKVVTENEMVINRSAEELRKRVMQLQVELKNLLQLYTEKDRRVVSKQEELKTVEAQLLREQEFVQGREQIALNPIRRTLEQEYVNSQARVEALGAKLESLKKQIASTRTRLAHLNDKSSEYSRLVEAVQRNQQNHALYKKRSEESRISEAMDREKLLNVAIVERAALPLQPIGRKMPMTLALAALTGLAVGVGCAFGIEFFNSAINTEKELEEELQLPVLVTIEKFPV
ncbi:MAG TPA: Wzz/FepE/Etk N-terminal domain-containing protein [Candidatus Eisenbacteria bacterium]|nr:Wzz/FepE/Etk N-terminal domain-containing protein [Candidatus Eisenbacteria bacterium]